MAIYMDKLDELFKYQRQIIDLEYLLNILNWEANTIIPEPASENVMRIQSEIDSKLFKTKNSSKYKKMLEDCINSEEFKVLGKAERKCLEKLLKMYKKDADVPPTFYKKFAKLKEESVKIWCEAKEKNDFNIFKPYLEKIVSMTKDYYNFRAEKTNIYDMMLDDFESGMTTRQLDKYFKEIKFAVSEILSVQKDEIDSIKLAPLSLEEKEKCAEFLLKYIGFDIERAVLNSYIHPFTQKTSLNDVRITYDKETDIFDFVMTVIHEGGHGLFEQNVGANLNKYGSCCLSDLTALHESQARFYENILGRNKNFWIPIYDEFKQIAKLDLSLDEFMEHLTAVKPGSIRTSADEVSYCMHIIIRYEIEKDLFNDKISVEDIPLIWKNKMKEYLNVEVSNDRENILQDIHWAEGSFGYFPSYLIGNIYDGMLLDMVENELGSLDELLKNGRIKEITNFLNNSIHRNGGAYTFQEIVAKEGYDKISPEFFLNYLQTKYDK